MLHIRLKQVRERAGLTQKQAAKEIGVSQAFLSALELGDKRPSVAMLKKIADFYRVTITYLAGEEEVIPSATLASDAAEQIRFDAAVNPGLKALAENDVLCEELSIAQDEWRMLHAVKLPCTATASGYIQILATLRGVCR